MSNNPAYMAARDKLAEAIREYDRTVSSEARVVIASTVVYEVSIFDPEDGAQVYSLQHVILDGSLCSAAGMLDSAKFRLNTYINNAESERYSQGDED